ncbi:MAG: hypothetical protein CSB55_00970 [Candidatus Cloacimonadota bacterium]|nr:MAG: hypothetical protein CSB55_00970 [Candidatus Cloacimonadota bacterium]
MNEKKEMIKKIMKFLAKNEEAKADELCKLFLEKTKEVTPEELTDVAQQLEDENIFADAEQHINIEKRIFEIIRNKIPQRKLSEFGKGHPIKTFLDENIIIKNLNKRAEELLQEKNSFTDLYSDWALLAKQYLKLHIHYLRKENQLFPYLERRGFSHPSSIMWSLHDQIRKSAKDFNVSVNEKK